MKETNCFIFDKYRKFAKSKISYIFKKALGLSFIYSKCKNEDEEIFKEKKKLRY